MKLPVQRYPCEETTIDYIPHPDDGAPHVRVRLWLNNPSAVCNVIDYEIQAKQLIDEALRLAPANPHIACIAVAEHIAENAPDELNLAAVQVLEQGMYVVSIGHMIYTKPFTD